MLIYARNVARWGALLAIGAAAAMTTKLRSISSKIACPWCAVGLNTLEAGLVGTGSLNFQRRQPRRSIPNLQAAQVSLSLALSHQMNGLRLRPLVGKAFTRTAL